MGNERLTSIAYGAIEKPCGTRDRGDYLRHLLSNTVSKPGALRLVTWGRGTLKRKQKEVEIRAHIFAADRTLGVMVIFYPFISDGAGLYNTLDAVVLKMANTRTTMNNNFNSKSYGVIHAGKGRYFVSIHADRFVYGPSGIEASDLICSLGKSIVTLS